MIIIKIKQCNSNQLNVSCDCRVQFTLFFSTLKEVCEFMSQVSALKINIYAYNIINLSKHRVLLKIVPSNKSSQSFPDLNTVRCLLHELDLEYSEDEVLRIRFNTSFTGEFSATVCELSQCVDISYGYIAEDGCLIFEVSSIDKAIKLFCS